MFQQGCLVRVSVFNPAKDNVEWPPGYDKVPRGKCQAKIMKVRKLDKDYTNGGYFIGEDYLHTYQ